MEAVGRGRFNRVYSSIFSLLSWATYSLKLQSNEPTTHMAEQMSYNAWLIWRNKIIIPKNEIEKINCRYMNAISVKINSNNLFHHAISEGFLEILQDSSANLTGVQQQKSFKLTSSRNVSWLLFCMQSY